ncbi:MAG: hypothetical protein L0G99_13080 [Propionibacteriales bacterium]|nr:hypothetical protein [Propionibacteriales bacterium]
MGIDGGPDVHGGITYGPAPDGWIGFDFLHAGDHWPGSPIPAFPRDAERTKADVLCEALNLCEQIAVTRREAGTRTAHGLEPVAERVVMRSRKPGYLGALILHGYDELGPFSLEFAVNPEEGVTLEYDAEVTR